MNTKDDKIFAVGKRFNHIHEARCWFKLNISSRLIGHIDEIEENFVEYLTNRHELHSGTFEGGFYIGFPIRYTEVEIRYIGKTINDARNNWCWGFGEEPELIIETISVSGY